MNHVTLNIKLVADNLDIASAEALSKAQSITGELFVLSIVSTNISFLPDDSVEFNFSITGTKQDELKGVLNFPTEIVPPAAEVETDDIPEVFKNAGLGKMFIENKRKNTNG